MLWEKKQRHGCECLAAWPQCFLTRDMVNGMAYHHFPIALQESNWAIGNHPLVGGFFTPLKNMTASIGMMTFQIYGKIKNGNQTTNQH